MAYYSNYSAIRDYNIVRTFVRQTFMCIWAPYTLTPEEQMQRVKNIYENKTIDDNIKSAINNFCKHLEKGNQEDDKQIGEQTLCEVLNNNFFLINRQKEKYPILLYGCVSYNAHNCYKGVENLNQTHLIALGHYVGNLPVILTVSDLNNNLTNACDLMSHILKGELTFVAGYTVFGEKISDVALRFLQKMAAVSSIQNVCAPKRLDDTAAKEELAESEKFKPQQKGTFDDVFETDLIGYHDDFMYQDQKYLYNSKLEEYDRCMLKSFCSNKGTLDERDVFARGVIFNLLASYLVALAKRLNY